MSNIEWTDTTWNPVVGCTPVSPGCLNCYAATMARRLEAMGRPEYVGLTVKRKGSTRAAGPEDATVAMALGKISRDVFNGTVRCLPDRLTDPLHWRKPRRVFVNSMSDLFHESVPFEFIDRVFAVMALCPQHTFQVLTKRPERMAEYLNRPWPTDRLLGLMDWAAKLKPGLTIPDGWGMVRDGKTFVPNVWLGTSVEDQARADERIPHLLRCPAAVRFLSCEPLLGEIDLGFPQGCRGCNHPGNIMPTWNAKGRCSRCDGTRQEPSGIDWVIVGGESGPNARPCDVAWIRSIVGQCRDAGVPVFVKQLGAWPRELSAGNPPAPMPWVWDDGGEQIERWYKPRDRKGGEPSEWPEDLRVRQWPGAAQKGEVR